MSSGVAITLVGYLSWTKITIPPIRRAICLADKIVIHQYDKQRLHDASLDESLKLGKQIEIVHPDVCTNSRPSLGRLERK